MDFILIIVGLIAIGADAIIELIKGSDHNNLMM